MKQFRLLLTILTLLAVGSMNTWAETVTYTFTSKSFADATQSWTATTTAFGFDELKGVQRTKGTAVATTKTEISNITKISISAATTSKGVGTYSVKVGDSEVGSKSLSKQSTLSTYTLYEGTPISGKVAITMNCTANSLYLKSVTIETSSTSCTTLATPTGLTVSDLTPTSAVLKWDAVSNAAKYQIITTPPIFGANNTCETNEITYTANNLTPETTYTWTVKALGNGTTYCDSEKSANATFTTPAKPKYTITWSSPTDTIAPTSVTQGDKIGTLPPAPAVPQGCPDKVFMGWSATNIGTSGTDNAPTFITAQTIPTDNTTYYAVFATQEGSGVAGWTLVTSESDLIAGQIYTIASSETPNSGKVLGKKSTNNYDEADWTSVSTIPTQLTLGGSANAWTLNDGTGYLYAASSSKNYLQTQSTNDQNGQWSITFSQTAVIKARGTNTHNTIKYNSNSKIFSCYTGGQQAVYLFKYSAGSTYTDYVTNCVECTVPTTPLALTIVNATLNLGEDGKAKTTFSTTDGNGATITYTLSDGATLDETNKTITFTQAGTYTLTARQDLNTTDGTTYCGSRDSKTITITKNPVFGAATIDKSSFDVACGDTTSMNSAAVITMATNYNLTKPITITAPEGFLVSTNKTDRTKYAASVTLTPTASGINAGKITANVYVRAYSAMARTDGYSGNITIAGDEITTQTLAVSSTVTCTEYTLTFKDRGTTYATKDLYAGAELAQSAFPADPTGVCTEPINYIFAGWATAEVAEGSTAYTKVPFPYTMPAANTTLYAVYKYSTTISNDYQKITDQASLTDGEYLVVGYRSSTYEALSSSIEGSTNGQYKAVAVTPTSDVITTDDETLIWNVSVANGKYTIAQGGQYLNINNSVMVLESTAIPYTLTVSSGVFTFTTTDSKSSSSTKISYYANNSVFNAYRNANTIYLYRRQQDTYYTTAPSCTPCIKGTDDITVTSAQGIWVEAVTPLNITATNLDKNADGANVTITATSLTDGFTLKTQGTNGSGSESVTLETGYSNSTYNANLTVVYSPTADNIIEEGKIALRVYCTNGTTTYATDTIIVRGRSLPAEFVLAAETTSGWVALPADLGTSSTDAVKKPYTISVDDDAAPTKATLAPQSALYSAAMRSTVNAVPTGLRFKAGEKYLQGSQSKGETKVWLSSTNSEQMQSWELHSSNLTDYFVRLRAAEEGRYLSYNATQDKIANYKQESRLRILPVENTCVRYDAPNISVHALISTSVTFVWEAIAGVTDYEYSLDGEKTWQACGDIETPGTEVKWTLANLTSETKYTVYIRAKVADGKSNCSASDSETFTTPTCDDVPVDLWVSPTANAATIMWSAKAPTATVKIYADEQGTKLVKETPNAATPCKIIGLEQNTDYYYQVLAGGSCASAIAHFKTESNEVSIVEWKKDAVIVDLNTEVTDADEVSILVEGQKTHGTNNNVADDLFFSKYYEATGNVKLVAIYNGTKDTLPLTNVKIKLGITSWDTKEISMAEYGEYKRGHIAPDEEIILWYYVEKDATDEKIVSCVKNKINIDILNKESNVSFSGRQTLALVRGSDIIDIMGAINIKDTNVDNVKPITGNCEPSWGDIEENRTWCGTGYSLDDPTQEIELSMNRCLLVRSNKVTSGDSAVINNVGAFKTFTKGEWLGRQVTKGDDNGVTESCNGFAYVADFNYNDYYTTYDSIANLEIKGNRNEDGTYTIPISKLDTMACTNLRLQLKKKGTIQATREEKVPIIIYKNTDTKSSEFFGEKLTDEICKTCDVVVRDNAQLSHIAGGKQQFRDMYVYTGSSLNIPENQTMSLDKVRMFATNDSVSYAVINNSNDAAAAISVKEVSHVKRIDGRYWYPFSLPYDCNIADIDQLNGQPLGVYGTDWGIKYYDGQRRQSDGNSTTHYGEVSKYWTMMPEDGQLKAYTGYIIGLFVPAADEPLMKSVNFPPATESAYTEDASSKTTPITNWPDNLNAEPRHHGWNFVGSPYISLFGSNNNTLGEGLYNTNVKMGWTDALGNQKDIDHIYVSIPNGGNTNTYTQALASGVTIRPFSAYFVQAIDPTDGKSNTLNLTYSKGPRSLPTSAPARTAKTDALILTELDITNGALGDNTGVLVSNVYSAEYEIGDDLTKMYAAAQKPQLYTIDAHNDKMAYQALPDVLAHAIPLGIYVPQAGNYTLSLNRYVSRLEAAEAVYLLHNGAVVANLLLSDYTVSASAKGTISGYSLDIRRAPEVVTDIVPAAGDAPYIIARDGVLAIANLPADAVVQVYDVLGHRLLQTDTHAAGTLQVPVPQTGVYTVVITTADGQQVLKTLLR